MADGAQPGEWEQSEQRGHRVRVGALALLVVAAVAAVVAIAVNGGPRN